MAKKGGDLEILAVDFLELIFKELKFAVVRKRIQLSGSQDGYDNLVEIVDNKYFSRSIYSECKDYTTELNYTDALIKLPQIASTHEGVDLVLFISPKKNFSNIFEEKRNKPFLESLANTHFKVAFLSPETDIQKYFSLYPEIYKKAYNTIAPILTNDDREEILNQFDKFIFSNKNLQKIVIDELDKEKFIGDIKTNKYHIERSIRNSQKREYEHYFPISNKKTLFTEIHDNKLGIILLGNPGFGKTSELKQLAIELWNTRESSNTIPTFKSLKNFTVTSRIEDFIPQNFKLIPNQIIIFDGIDEIENIIDFSNKLRNFIADNSELLENNFFKFILSCRTNIYNKFIKGISGFEIYFLNEISISSGLVFLKTKFNLDLELSKTFDIYKNKEVLENPFYLDLIGNYFQKHNTILTNKALLIEEFVNSRLNDDKLNKYRNDSEFDKERIISYTQKIAFTLESMQKPFITSLEIKKITKINEISLAKNSFLEENITGSWSFVLKNIQEYFVANILSELSFDDIIKILKIDANTNKVHPTWQNVVTFLLNIISDEELYNSLIDWLMKNDFEILFNADTDRVTDEIKSKVLLNLFTKNCIEDNLWINDPKSIASFSECNTNIEYLIHKMGDSGIHRRARMSAIKLLSYMTVPDYFHEQVSEIIIDIINEDFIDDENHVYLIQDAILLTKCINLNNNVIYFNKIIELLKERDEKEIISSIISCVTRESVIENLHYFFDILDKTIGVKKWNSLSKYNSITSTKENIFNLFTKIKNGNTLLEIYEFSIERQKNYQFRESLLKEFLNHIKEFFKNNNEFNAQLIELISNAVIKDKNSHYEDNLLLEVAKSCGIEKQLFHIIIESINGNSDRKHFLAEIINKDDFEKILIKYNEKTLNEDFLNQFRNVLSHKNFSLSKDFENYIESNTKYIFKDKFSEENIIERDLFWSTRDQKNFDILFDNDEIVNQILKFYEYLNVEVLNFKDINLHYHRYYEDFELRKIVTESAKHVLYEILRRSYSGQEKLKKEDIRNEVLSSSQFIMNDILNNLPKDNNIKKINISESQKQLIKKWCDDNSILAKDYYRNHLSISKRWDNDKYYLFETIYKFQNFFKFNLDEELLLDMLWFNTTEKEINTTFLESIVSIEKVNNRILFNLTKTELHPASFCNHLKYCVDNKINIGDLDLKLKVYDFLNSGNYYYAGEIIENFFREDIEILKELLNYESKENNETNRFLYDSIIKLLTKQNQESFAINFLLKNNSNLIENKIFTEKEIIRKLISLNYENAFEKFYDLLKNQIDNNLKGEFEFRDQDWLKFTKPEAIDILVKIFELCLSVNNIDDLFGSHFSPLRTSSETIINICKNNSELICAKTIDLLDNINNYGKDSFYLNKLKNDTQEIYYKHKSKPYNIAEVLKILEENRHLFIV